MAGFVIHFHLELREQHTNARARAHAVRSRAHVNACARYILSPRVRAVAYTQMHD